MQGLQVRPSFLPNRSELGLQAVMGAAVVAHVVEAAVIVRMCQKRALSCASSSGWVLIVLLVGYFGILEFKLQCARRRR